MPDDLVVNEIYLSLQGESTFAGLPCIFIRLTACNLRCSYCDTAYAFTEGQKKSVSEILAKVNRIARSFGEKVPVGTQLKWNGGTQLDIDFRENMVSIVGQQGGCT